METIEKLRCLAAGANSIKLTKFINEANDVPGLVLNVLDEYFKLLFELTANARPCHDGGEVDRQDALVLQRLYGEYECTRCTQWYGRPTSGTSFATMR